MTTPVLDILNQIAKLSEEDRLSLEERLEEMLEVEWKREAGKARDLAKTRGINQEAIDRALHELRYPS